MKLSIVEIIDQERELWYEELCNGGFERAAEAVINSMPESAIISLLGFVAERKDIRVDNCNARMNGSPIGRKINDIKTRNIALHSLMTEVHSMLGEDFKQEAREFFKSELRKIMIYRIKEKAKKSEEYRRKNLRVKYADLVKHIIAKHTDMNEISVMQEEEEKKVLDR